MKFDIVNRPKVEEDIMAIALQYKSADNELSQQFLFRLNEARNYIVKIPEAFQIKYKNVRTVLLKQFPYQIHYIIDESQKQIVVLAVIHSYKKPNDYSER